MTITFVGTAFTWNHTYLGNIRDPTRKLGMGTVENGYFSNCTRIFGLNPVENLLFINLPKKVGQNPVEN